MARNLYRFYLYVVFIALLIFAAVGLGQLLNTVLAFTPLRGLYSNVPTQAEVVQSVVFVTVSWIAAGLLGGLHYWLIRRDMRHDPTASTSAIRLFFLHITEACSVLVGVPVMGMVISSLAFSSDTNVVGAASGSIAALLLALVLELERRRTPVTKGVAMVFQRIHFYGVQIILLLFLTPNWFTSFRPLVDILLFGRRGLLESCQFGTEGPCPTYNVFGLICLLLWFAAFWIGYGLMIRKDNARLLRLILHHAGFAYGIGFVLAGLYYVFQLVLLPLFGETLAFKDVLGPSPRYDFVSPLTLGLFIGVIYYIWLRAATKQGLIEQAVLYLIECAITAVLSAAVFWWGIGYTLYNALHTVSPIPANPDAQAWISSLAFIVAGLGYVPLGFYLYRRNALDPVVTAGPRRGFVLALLGGGILAFAIGGATALYAWATAVFGSPITDWQQVAQIGLAAFIVGVILVGVYLWIAIREHLFSGLIRRTTPATAVVPAAPQMPEQLSTIEDVLSALLANKITQNEAATRLHTLTNAPVEAGK